MNRQPGVIPQTPSIEVQKAQLAARFLRLVQVIQRAGMSGFGHVLETANSTDVIDMSAALDILETQFSRVPR